MTCDGRDTENTTGYQNFCKSPKKNEEDEERNMYILTVYREGRVTRRMFRDEAEAIKRMRKQIQHPEVIEATVSDLDKLTIRTPCATFKMGRT